MNPDPHDVGLPPLPAGPPFVATDDALVTVRARHAVRRRQRQERAGSLALVTLTVLVTGALLRDGGGAGDQLEQAVVPSPSVVVASPEASSAPGPSAAAALASPGAPVLAAPAATVSPRVASRTSGPRPRSERVTSTVTRSLEPMVVGIDAQCQDAQAWAASGWCFLPGIEQRREVGRPSTQTLDLCRLPGFGGGPVSLPAGHQSVFSVLWSKGVRWTSAEDPATTREAELLVVQPETCVRWTMRWDGRLRDGTPLPAGQYGLEFRDLSNLRGRAGQPFVFVSTYIVAEPST